MQIEYFLDAAQVRVELQKYEKYKGLQLRNKVHINNAIIGLKINFIKYFKILSSSSFKKLYWDSLTF